MTVASHTPSRPHTLFLCLSLSFSVFLCLSLSFSVFLCLSLSLAHKHTTPLLHNSLMNPISSSANHPSHTHRKTPATLFFAPTTREAASAQTALSLEDSPGPAGTAGRRDFVRHSEPRSWTRLPAAPCRVCAGEAGGGRKATRARRSPTKARCSASSGMWPRQRWLMS
jgi:hypothetical protein